MVQGPRAFSEDDMPRQPNGREPELSEDDIQREQLGPRGVPGKESPTKMTPQRERKRRRILIRVTRLSRAAKPGQAELPHILRSVTIDKLLQMQRTPLSCRLQRCWISPSTASETSSDQRSVWSKARVSITLQGDSVFTTTVIASKK